MGSAKAVLILDFGSQYTQLIARRVREMGVFSYVLPADAHPDKWAGMDVRAVILSGGPASVTDPSSPQLSAGVFESWKQAKMPILGICYGMQLLAHLCGGKVTSANRREYGRMPVIPVGLSGLLSEGNPFQAWMSHGDEIEVLPQGFRATAHSQSGSLSAMENATARLYGLQFHPEVTHTERGTQILENFVLKLAGITPDWSMGSVREEQVARIRSRVREGEHVLCALSGGVDSAVAAKLVSEAVGERLHCIFVDHGLMRLDERKQVMGYFEGFGLKVDAVDASERFLSKLSGVTDPEQKRKIIGTEFIRVFEEESNRIEKLVGKPLMYLVQGTLYPDVIESSPAPSETGAGGTPSKHAAKIKSHHNVGGLPKDLKFELIEPLRDLFKDEVRVLGRTLGVPDVFVKRHPFPGPGLGVRILGDVTRERVAILQKVDAIFIEEIRAAGLYDKIWQAFAVFLPIRSVGVQGDGRTHDHVVGLRAVTSTDGMTADWYDFEAAFLRKVSSRICNEVRGVNRVVYDISSKPPATIEWE